MSSLAEAAAGGGRAGLVGSKIVMVTEMEGEGCCAVLGAYLMASGPWWMSVLLERRGCGLPSVDSPALTALCPYLPHEAGFHPRPLGSATC